MQRLATAMLTPLRVGVHARRTTREQPVGAPSEREGEDDSFWRQRACCMRQSRSQEGSEGELRPVGSSSQSHARSRAVKSQPARVCAFDGIALAARGPPDELLSQRCPVREHVQPLLWS